MMKKSSIALILTIVLILSSIYYIVFYKDWLNQWNSSKYMMIVILVVIVISFITYLEIKRKENSTSKNIIWININAEIIKEKNWIFNNPEEILACVPLSLQKYKQNISDTITSYVKISLSEATFWDELVKSRLWWYPHNMSFDSYPKDSDWSYMLFLAQIDYSEIPELEGNPCDWLLQIFISPGDWLWIDYANWSNSDVLVRYIEKRETKIELSKNEMNIITESLKKFDIPIEWYPKQYNLSFISTFMTPLYYETHEFQNIKFETEEDIETYIDFANDIYGNTPNHQIWGYPSYTQNEVRKGNEQVLIFQIDSELGWDNKYKILRWDIWIMNIFMEKKDLEKNNFKDFLYTRDCH